MLKAVGCVLMYGKSPVPFDHDGLLTIIKSGGFSTLSLDLSIDVFSNYTTIARLTKWHPDFHKLTIQHFFLKNLNQ